MLTFCFLLVPAATKLWSCLYRPTLSGGVTFVIRVTSSFTSSNLIYALKNLCLSSMYASYRKFMFATDVPFEWSYFIQVHHFSLRMHEDNLWRGITFHSFPPPNPLSFSPSINSHFPHRPHSHPHSVNEASLHLNSVCKQRAASLSTWIDGADGDMCGSRWWETITTSAHVWAPCGIIKCHMRGGKKMHVSVVVWRVQSNMDRNSETFHISN